VVERTKSPTGSKDAVIERVVSRQSIAEQQHVQRQSSGSHTPPAMKGAAASRASPQSPQTAPTSPQTSASSPAVARAPAGEKQKPGQEEGEFTIVLKKSSPDESLGADIAGTPDTKALKIVSWKGDSLIEKWNSDNPAKQVKKGDLVVAANGMEGSVVTIIAEIKRSMVIELRIKRELVSAKAAGSAASSASSSSGAAAPGKGAGPPPAASDQEASESAESSAKEEGSDEEDDEEDSDSEESASEGKDKATAKAKAKAAKGDSDSSEEEKPKAKAKAKAKATKDDSDSSDESEAAPKPKASGPKRQVSDSSEDS